MVTAGRNAPAQKNVIYFTAKGRSFDEMKNNKNTIVGDSINQNFKYVPPPFRNGQAV